MRHRPYDPARSLPVCQHPVRALFIKRWGVLLEPHPPPAGLCFDPGLLSIGAVDALFRARQSGWLIYLIGNEDAVARGRFSQAQWSAFEAALLDHLAGRGAGVSRSYASLDHPAAKGPNQRRSVFQLPDTGIFYHAAQHDGVTLEESWVIGDSTLDLAGGERAGCKVAAVRTGLGLSDRELEVEPHFTGGRLCEVVDALASALRRAAG